MPMTDVKDTPLRASVQRLGYWKPRSRAASHAALLALLLSLSMAPVGTAAWHWCLTACTGCAALHVSYVLRSGVLCLPGHHAGSRASLPGPLQCLPGTSSDSLGSPRFQRLPLTGPSCSAGQGTGDSLSSLLQPS